MPRSRFLASYWYWPCLTELIRYRNWSIGYLSDSHRSGRDLRDASTQFLVPVIWEEKTRLGDDFKQALKRHNHIRGFSPRYNLPDSLVTVRNEAFFSKRMNIAHIRRGFHSEDVRLIMMRAVFQSDFDWVVRALKTALTMRMAAQLLLRIHIYNRQATMLCFEECREAPIVWSRRCWPSRVSPFPQRIRAEWIFCHQRSFGSRELSQRRLGQRGVMQTKLGRLVVPEVHCLVFEISDRDQEMMSVNALFNTTFHYC